LILSQAFSKGAIWGILATLVSFLTAFYSFRQVFRLFHKGEESKVDESSAIMLLPMALLALFSFMSLLLPLYGKSLHIDLPIAILSMLASALGIALAYGICFTPLSIMSEKSIPLSKAFKSQLYTEALYHKVLAVGFRDLSVGINRFFERIVIDGFVNLSYSLVNLVGSSFRAFQNGNLNIYALIASFGIFSVLVFTLLWR
ncbi:MAG: hypothetical protein NZL90_01015, partial [Aquificaceae bacterium]|nr:hypothetical protein [Aquificaceae bacterium]